MTEQSWRCFFGFRKPLYRCTKGMCHSSTCPSTIIPHDSVLPGLPPR